MSTVSETQREQLSAYLDGMLPEAERRQLDLALQSDPDLAAELRDLQTTAALLRDLPPVRPPRSFTLDPATVAPRRRTFGFAWTRWAAVVGALALFLTVGLNTLTGGSAPNAVPAQSSAGNAAAPATTRAFAESPAENAAGALPAPPMTAQDAPSEEPLPDPLLAPSGGGAPEMGAMATISGTLEVPAAGGAPMDTQRSTITITDGTTLPEFEAAGGAVEQGDTAITDSASLASQAPAGLVAPEFDTTDTSSPDTRELKASPFGPNFDAPQAAAPAADESPNLGLLFGLLALTGLLGALALTLAARRIDRRH